MFMSQAEMRFDVFGRHIAVRKKDGAWECFLLGADGKRREMNLVIPAFVPEEEVLQFLADILHECATPTNGRPVRLQ
jgi:hypothetical protein